MAIRVGLIGIGRVGRAHLESLGSFTEVEIAAICDSNRERAERAAQPYGAGVHINFRTMIEAERLDAVFVSLPPFARGEPEIVAARSGIHLFVERPVAVSVAKAREIQAEIARAGVLASVAYPWRYLSGTERVAELLKDRKVALVEGRQFGPVPDREWCRRRESSGGRFVQEATDLLDLARHLLGEVTGVCAVQFEGIVAARLAGYDVEDALAAVLRFRSGAVGSIISADIAPREEAALSIITDETAFRITPTSVEMFEKGQYASLDHTGQGLRPAQEAFLKAVKSGDAGLIRSPYADAVRTLEVAAAVAESALSGKFVNL